MNTATTKSEPAPVCVDGSLLSQRLSDETYVRARVRPSLTDLDYLQLKDLYSLLKSIAPSFRGDVFDYGCGGAPYRELFAACRNYVKADVTASLMLDRVLPPSGLTDEPDASYDWVISTQVLEHVADPRGYLNESRRILRPDGQLFLSTHGMVHEHGCPYDFQRWTCRGLELLALESGFEIVSAGKFTTCVRGVVQIANQLATYLRADGRPLLHYPLALVRHAYGWVFVPLLNLFAELFPHQAVVPSSDPATLYVGIFMHARKK